MVCVFGDLPKDSFLFVTVLENENIFYFAYPLDHPLISHILEASQDIAIPNQSLYETIIPSGMQHPWPHEIQLDTSYKFYAKVLLDYTS